ncbi:MAG: DnaJ domain-containing protein [Proteobacteria bacterium]|nr:DnaJ domain-containing protein [Pseudomonadota bacterium]
MKDYYQILGVTSSSHDEEIRKRYRTLAMQFHPDRNPDNPQAEDKFKEIAEAYGVLTDPVKRRQYDAARSRGRDFQGGRQNAGFDYSQEDILRDLFDNPQFQQLFNSLLGDFKRSGFRANPLFLKQIFFGGRGGFLMGGLVFFGSLMGPALVKSLTGKSAKKGLLHHVGQTVGSLLKGTVAPTSPSSAVDLDILYHIGLSAEELGQGKWVQVAVGHDQQKQHVLKVKIPSGSSVGQKLRVRGKGRSDGSGRQGDLYLQLEGL